jgi:hypothetical protein
MSPKEFTETLRKQTGMSLKEAYSRAVKYAKVQFLTVKQQEEFYMDLFTPQQIKMLLEDE